jgi:hypothetical protein
LAPLVGGVHAEVTTVVPDNAEAVRLLATPRDVRQLVERAAKGITDPPCE